MPFFFRSIWKPLRGLRRSKLPTKEAATTQSNSHGSVFDEAVVDPSILNATVTHQPTTSESVHDQARLLESASSSESEGPVANEAINTEASTLPVDAITNDTADLIKNVVGATANSENTAHGKASNQSLAGEAVVIKPGDVSDYLSAYIPCKYLDTHLTDEKNTRIWAISFRMQNIATRSYVEHFKTIRKVRFTGYPKRFWSIS